MRGRCTGLKWPLERRHGLRHSRRPGRGEGDHGRSPGPETRRPVRRGGVGSDGLEWRLARGGGPAQRDLNNGLHAPRRVRRHCASTARSCSPRLRPFTEELFWTDGGLACVRRDGATSRSSRPRHRTSRMSTSTSLPQRPLVRGVETVLHARVHGRLPATCLSTTLALTWVAAGRRAVYVTDGDVRDSVHFAAGIALCRAAGALVAGLRGQPLHTGVGGLVVAANTSHQARSAVAGRGSARTASRPPRAGARARGRPARAGGSRRRSAGWPRRRAPARSSGTARRGAPWPPRCRAGSDRPRTAPGGSRGSAGRGRRRRGRRGLPRRSRRRRPAASLDPLGSRRRQPCTRSCGGRPARAAGTSRSSSAGR